MYQLVVTAVFRISALGLTLYLYLIRFSFFLSNMSWFGCQYYSTNKNSTFSYTHACYPFLILENLSCYEMCSDFQHIHTLMIKAEKIIVDCISLIEKAQQTAISCSSFRVCPHVCEQRGQEFEIKSFHFSSQLQRVTADECYM